ncbi:acetyltransferase [Sphingomonas sp. LR60]|uniref:N-acyl amino acid synthase FeeM domain-containing protein n=1 Tax=Sphingomonas sp. LR60 TaxID=3050233 RepID=UPI002FE1AE33
MLGKLISRNKYHRPIRKSPMGGFAYRGGGSHFVEIASIYDNGSPITINVADSETARESACSLINRRYIARGYGGDHRITTNPSSLTFTAFDGQMVFGTLTLGVDSGAGLAADRTFRDQIDRFRQKPYVNVCELTSLAVDAAIPSTGLLAAIFHFAFIYGSHHRMCTDLFIEVNPRHRRFYEAMLGFISVGDVRINESVAAPAQLMHLQVSYVRGQIDNENKRLRSDRNRSLYPFFFSLDDESMIAAHVRS